MVALTNKSTKIHFIILKAIARPNYECLWPDVGCNGRNNDGEVWNESTRLFTKEFLNSPHPSYLRKCILQFYQLVENIPHHNALIFEAC